MTEFGETAELVDELVMESARLDEENGSLRKWHRQVAMSTLVMALITAVGALLAGITAHEALLDRTEEIIDISIVEGDRVSVEVLKTKVDIIRELGQSPNVADLALIQAYEAEAGIFAEEADAEESQVQAIGATHLVLAVAVSLLSVGITLSGMAIIVDLKFLWLAGLVLGIVGSIGVAYGIFTYVF